VDALGEAGDGDPVTAELGASRRGDGDVTDEGEHALAISATVTGSRRLDMRGRIRRRVEHST
jgi:hypothetical protein